MSWFIGIIVTCISCNKPVCPAPNTNYSFAVSVDTSYCAATNSPVVITNCTKTVLENVNRLLYARANPEAGIQHRQCPAPESWKPNEVIYNGSTYHLFTFIDSCNGVNVPYIFISDAPKNDFEFHLYNAVKDYQFEYYGYCPPALVYRADKEADADQSFLFYYQNQQGNRVSIAKQHIVSVKSISLDCDYINNYSSPFVSNFYFLNSSFGISVELEVKDLEGFPSGHQVIKAYVQSLTGSGGIFSAWVASVHWKTVL